MGSMAVHVRISDLWQLDLRKQFAASCRLGLFMTDPADGFVDVVSPPMHGDSPVLPQPYPPG